jgi:hypothetical protein
MIRTPHTPHDAEALSDLAGYSLIAELPMVPVKIHGRRTHPASMKAVLLVLWKFRGQPIAVEAVSERAGVCNSSAYRSIDALVLQGIVAVEAMPQGRVFRFNEAALRRGLVQTPLLRSRGPKRPSGWSRAASEKGRRAIAARRQAASEQRRAC